MPTRYFDVDPLVEGLGYGFAGFMQGRREFQEEQARRTRARKAQQRKILTAGIGAGVGAGAGIALAPVLGLGGSVAAGADLGTSTAGYTTLTGLGALEGGLGGAAVGAQAGSAFAEGDIAGGLGAIARPVIGALERQEARRQGMADRAEDRTARLSDAMTLDRFRTDENLRQASEASTIPTYGLPRAQATQAARAAYEAELGRQPRAGEDLGLPPPYAPEYAYGDIGGPGGSGTPSAGGMGPPAPPDSGTPPMEENWGPGEYAQLRDLYHRKSQKVDNPKWRQSATEAEQAAEWNALANVKREIRPGMVPRAPTMQERVRKNTWKDPVTGDTFYDPKETRISKASKASEQKHPFVYDDPNTGTSTEVNGDFGPVPGDRTGRMWRRTTNGIALDPPKAPATTKADQNIPTYLEARAQFVKEAGNRVYPDSDKERAGEKIPLDTEEIHNGAMKIIESAKRAAGPNETAAEGRAGTNQPIVFGTDTQMVDALVRQKASGKPVEGPVYSMLKELQDAYPNKLNVPPDVAVEVGRLLKLLEP